MLKFLHAADPPTAQDKVAFFKLCLIKKIASFRSHFFTIQEQFQLFSSIIKHFFLTLSSSFFCSWILFPQTPLRFFFYPIVAQSFYSFLLKKSYWLWVNITPLSHFCNVYIYFFFLFFFFSASPLYLLLTFFSPCCQYTVEPSRRFATLPLNIYCAIT